MNREQRRKLAKKSVTDKDIKALYETTKQESVRQAVDVYNVAVATVLHDKLGFGEVRLKRVLAQIEDTFDSIAKDYVKVEELRKMILDECNIDIKRGG